MVHFVAPTLYSDFVLLTCCLSTIYPIEDASVRLFGHNQAVIHVAHCLVFLLLASELDLATAFRILMFRTYFQKFGCRELKLIF